MKKKILTLVGVLTVMAVVAVGVFMITRPKPLFSPNNPVDLTIWHYYSSIQQTAFDGMVEEFNLTRGKELGIFIQSLCQGNVNELFTKVLDTANGIAGEGAMPHLFLAYVDSAYELEQKQKIVDLSQYLTSVDIDAYVEGFWREGIIQGKPYVAPVAKSTELLMLDALAWSAYAQAAGIDEPMEDCFSTWERAVATARAYYEFTDAKTPDQPNDGNALLSIDSLANFMLSSLSQLGADLLAVDNGRGIVNINEDNLRRIWDIYVGSMARGYFASIGHFGSDDVKTDYLMGFVGSTAGVGYFPDTVTQADGTQRKAELAALPVPHYEGAPQKMIQQGAGMVVAKTDARHEAAAIEFIKWFTEPTRNINFSVRSAYLPVKKEALRGAVMDNALASLDSSADAVLRNTAQVFRVATAELARADVYSTPPFSGQLQVRRLLDDVKALAIEARQDVLEAVDEGMDYDEAVLQVSGEDAFLRWLDQFRQATDDILNKAS